MNQLSNAATANAHDDGLGWLRDIRKKLMTEAGNDLKRLSEHYRQVESTEPEKVLDPRKLLADAVRKASV